MYPLLAALHVLAIYGVPAATVGMLIRDAEPYGWAAQGVAWIAAPALFAFLVALCAGLTSRPYRHAVRSGRMVRDTSNSDYRARRLYGLAWTCIYYCPGVYHACLAVPPVKRMLFRLFGYKGSMNFTAYPDTWLRDLAVLDFGEGCYISNRATIGTNIVSRGGRIHVDGIRIGARALVGHFAMIAPGAVIGDDAEIGAGSGIGLRTRVGERARIADNVTIDHCATIGAGARIGTRAYIGRRATVLAGVTVPPAAVVPADAFVDENYFARTAPAPMLVHALSA